MRMILLDILNLTKMLSLVEHSSKLLVGKKRLKDTKKSCLCLKKKKKLGHRKLPNLKKKRTLH